MSKTEPSTHGQAFNLATGEAIRALETVQKLTRDSDVACYLGAMVHGIRAAQDIFYESRRPFEGTAGKD
jgi:hypothetical protein